MPKIIVMVNEFDMRLIKRIAGHLHRKPGRVTRSLVEMSLKTVRIEERTGLYYGPAPRLPKLSRAKPRCEGWTKEERDTWILTGEEPQRVQA